MRERDKLCKLQNVKGRIFFKLKNSKNFSSLDITQDIITFVLILGSTLSLI